MPTYSMNGVAGEDIKTCRVVTSSTTAEGSLSFLMADSNAAANVPVGVSQEGSYYGPGLTGTDEAIAAPSGRGVMVYGLGNTARVLCGGDVTAGTRVKVVAADGVIASLVGSENAGTWTVGIAEEDGESGELVRVFIDPAQVALPSS